MSQDLLGKWYVYRYNPSEHPSHDPDIQFTTDDTVLKAPETTLEISQQTTRGCLARFELRGRAEPVELEMIADDRTGDWCSPKGGSLNFRWARIERGGEEPLILAGEVNNRDVPNYVERDFFVAVRSRRTYRLRDEAAYQFGGAYRVPSVVGEHSKKWPDDDLPGVDLVLLMAKAQAGKKIEAEDKDEIRIGGNTYALTGSVGSGCTRFQGGFVIKGSIKGNAEPDYKDTIGLWVLPVAKPGQIEHLLAVGYHQYQERSDVGADESCHGLLELG